MYPSRNRNRCCTTPDPSSKPVIQRSFTQNGSHLRRPSCILFCSTCINYECRRELLPSVCAACMQHHSTSGSLETFPYTQTFPAIIHDHSCFALSRYRLKRCLMGQVVHNRRFKRLLCKYSPARSHPPIIIALSIYHLLHHGATVNFSRL